jgi:hypothetical protein
MAVLGDPAINGPQFRATEALARALGWSCKLSR